MINKKLCDAVRVFEMVERLVYSFHFAMKGLMSWRAINGEDESPLGEQPASENN